MQLKLESLPYQDSAMQAVINVFEGTEKNNFDNATIDNIRFNRCDLPMDRLAENISKVAEANAIATATASLVKEPELTIEMETGTGKTLVYLKTILELSRSYGFTKFIILVPSVAIRQGVLASFKAFKAQLEGIYGFSPHVFEYDSKKLPDVKYFIESQHPQVMVMTVAAFIAEDRILNQAQREDLFANIPYIDAIGKTNPIVIMDEPQEGMDTDNALRQIAKLKPLVKLRYSATHKVVKNLVFRLTPYDSYKDGLVKKIEVLTVIEKNDEATLKIELAEVQNGKGDPKVKLKAWHHSKATGKFDFKLTKWLKEKDNLGEVTNNPSYLDYKISRINKSLRTGMWSVTFANGAELIESQTAGNMSEVWALQIEWLIRRHFEKNAKLAPKGIKCLSLIFIDRVANYMGEEPVIKMLFVEKYKEIYPEYHGNQQADEQHIQAVQGYYFAQKSSGEFADNEGGLKEQAKIYELILRKREELLKIENPVQFIFSHSALGVGWDNPNVFNIATLNVSYSEIKKRQEIGRGLRIAVNQHGVRVYDAVNVKDDERINQLTVIPNETYETFVRQYQEEIKSIYGTTAAGAGTTNNHKGKPQGEVKFTRNRSETIDAAFKRFWKAMAKKTDFSVAFQEDNLIARSVEKINEIEIPDYHIEVSSHTITGITEEEKTDLFGGAERFKQKANFTALDLIEELSNNTRMSTVSVCKIVTQLTNLNQAVKNPLRYVYAAAAILRNMELEEMVRCTTYHLTGDEFPFDFEDYVDTIDKSRIVDTPNRGVFDKMLIDSTVERDFATDTDKDVDKVVCFLKLPSGYKIQTPIGDYEPDFGLVLKRKVLRDGNESEFYFVIETKGTNDINNKKALKEGEILKMKFAKKHFESIGIDVKYVAPIKEYATFATKAEQFMTDNPK